ncbi:hypothetical protein TREVI0001_1142 [Treponema vincentii ATCC 35580]|uniref:Uncharacterized protein n=1 Tax=Treponema vincentii ATCC 35580 TaxID=596324 RepID=C8PRX8_9SPIR|nr:hypothetical protein TREVI0001_1142 [Treponema vincentii ATCC 35580]
MTLVRIVDPDKKIIPANIPPITDKKIRKRKTGYFLIR